MSASHKEKAARRVLEILDSLPGARDAPTVAYPIRDVIHQGSTRGPCGKAVYDNEGQCRTAIKRRLSNGATSSFLRPYFCDECRGWHMTSRPHFKAG
jgi:hypothetical protein